MRTQRERFSPRAHTLARTCTSKIMGSENNFRFEYPNLMSRVDWLDDSIFALNHQTNRFSSQFPFVPGFKSDVEKNWILLAKFPLAKSSSRKTFYFSRNLLLAKSLAKIPPLV